MEPHPSLFEGRREPPREVWRPDPAEAVETRPPAGQDLHIPDLRDASLPPLPVPERDPQPFPGPDAAILDGPLFAPAPDPLPDPLPETHTVYCLWRHRSDQFPSLRAKLMEEIEGRSVTQINVFQEGVGGLPAERRAIEARMDAMVNGLSASRWLIEKIGSRVTAALYSIVNREAAEDTRFFVENVQLFRDIRAKTGAEVRFRLIDMDETHPSFQSISAAFFPGLDIVEGFLSLKTGEAFSNKAQAAVVITALAQAYCDQIERVGEAVRTRDDLVISQLDEHFAAAPEGSLNVVMVGSGHARIARGSSRPGFGRVVSAMPPHLEDKLPARFENSLSADLESMKMRKVACDLGLDIRDQKELIVYRLLYPLVATELAGKPELLNGRNFSEAVTLSSFMATHYILANRREVDSIFAACFGSLAAETDANATVREALERPLRTIASEIVTNPKKAIGFDPR